MLRYGVPFVTTHNPVFLDIQETTFRSPWRATPRNVPHLQNLHFLGPHSIRHEVVLVHHKLSGVLVRTRPAEQWELSQALHFVHQRTRKLVRRKGLVLGNAVRDASQVWQSAPRPADLHRLPRTPAALVGPRVGRAGYFANVAFTSSSVAKSPRSAASTASFKSTI